MLDQLPATPSAENLVEAPNWSPSVDTISSHELVEVEDPAARFVKADPVPESTPDSTLDSTLPKDWEKVSEPPDEVEIALRRSRPATSAGLAAPPLYAAGVSAREPRSLSESLDQALELSEQIQGVLSQGAIPDLRTEEERNDDSRRAAPAASCASSSSDSCTRRSQFAAPQHMRAERDQLKGLLDEGASRQQEVQQALMQTQQALDHRTAESYDRRRISAAGSSARKTVKRPDVRRYCGSHNP